LATLEIYYQNNPFLGMCQVKFCLNTLESCTLLYVCVLQCSILAIILFEYLSLDPSAKKNPKLYRRIKFEGCTSALFLTSRAYWPPSGSGVARGGTRPGAHQHTFCSNLKTRIKQKFRSCKVCLKMRSFWKKNYKNRLSVGGSASEPPFASGDWRLRPQTPAVMFPSTIMAC